MLNTRALAILLALFVTFIWSLSWVFIKTGLQDIPALTFAGLRYSLASLCLLALVSTRPDARQQIAHLPKRQWLELTVLGLVFYTLTQGTQFLALVYLPAITLSLMLNFTVALVALSGIFLGESPTLRQWLGIGLFIVGALIYMGPQTMPATIGLLIGGLSVVANATSSLLGRRINRASQLSPLAITTVSMSIGSALLLMGGVLTGGTPALQPASWLLVIWLAVVHTALTFTLWNQSLRHLQAFESSLINNTMLIQIAILAWLFLGEEITPIGAVGLGCAATDILVVQFSQRRSLFNPR